MQEKESYKKMVAEKMRVFPRLFISIVLFFNLQCAAVFLLNPEVYMSGFGLESSAGAQIVRAMGLLFVMWNVPYAFALVDPVRNKKSLIEAVMMQAIGLAGETLILLLGGPYPERITATITRFIIFDGGGLILLIAALLLVRRVKDGR